MKKDAKTRARQAAFARRKRSHETGGAREPGARALLLAHLAGRAGIVAGYMPIRTEIDPRPAMVALAARGHPLCLPVIDGPGRPLLFRQWSPGGALVAGPFGALVPAEGDWVEPDLLIVPLVAFTRQGYRLGYGGGFYDRTLEGLRARKPVHAVGYAYAAQEALALPLEPTDQPLNAIVTERGVPFLS